MRQVLVFQAETESSLLSTQKAERSANEWMAAHPGAEILHLTSASHSVVFRDVCYADFALTLVVLLPDESSRAGE